MFKQFSAAKKHKSSQNWSPKWRFFGLPGTTSFGVFCVNIRPGV